MLGTQAYAVSTEEVENIKLQKITSCVPEAKKISVVDHDCAVELIVDAVIKSQLLYFDGSTPVLKMPLHYQRLSEDEAEMVEFSFLDEKSQIIVPNRHIKETIKRLRFMSKLQIDLSEEFRKGQLYVNLTHGVYDILKQELVPLRNEIKFDYFINIRYIPHCRLDDAPVFKHYIETSVGMEQYECLMRVLGYCLSSLTKGRKAFVFYGIGRTGKSTVLNVLETVIGGGLVSHEPFDKMSNERAKAHYIGKRVNISRETSTRPNKNMESVKSLISNEMVTSEEKFQVQKDYIPTLSFIFAGNTDIECHPSGDDAILDRLVYLVFNKEIPESEIDLELEEKLLSEKDIIFSLALDSIKGLIEDKYDFKMGPAGEDHIKHRRLLIHSAESFLNERCMLSRAGKVSKVKLFDAYVSFCKANALKPIGRNCFYDKVRNFNPSITDGRAPNSSGNSVQGFHGISIIGGERKVNDDDSDN